MLERRKRANNGTGCHITWRRRRLSAGRLRRTGADVAECGVEPRCVGLARLVRPPLAVGVAGDPPPTTTYPRLHDRRDDRQQTTCRNTKHAHQQAHKHVQSRALLAPSPNPPASPSRRQQGRSSARYSTYQPTMQEATQSRATGSNLSCSSGSPESHTAQACGALWLTPMRRVDTLTHS